jgi:hypothetical protein
LLYHHPKNAKYYQLEQTTRQRQLGPVAYQCFPTLEAFATWLQRGNSTDCHYPYRHNVIEPKDCSELACATIHGKVRFFTHLFFNYRNILDTKLPLPSSSSSSSNEQQPQSRHIYVIRQEHLWEDWKRLNELVAADEDEKLEWTNAQQDSTPVVTTTTSHRNITGLQLPVTRDISPEGRRKLCLALETEYAAYFRLLQLAVNMKNDDVKDCARVAQQNCPHLNIAAMIH